MFDWLEKAYQWRRQANQIIQLGTFIYYILTLKAILDCVFFQFIGCRISKTTSTGISCEPAIWDPITSTITTKSRVIRCRLPTSNLEMIISWSQSSTRHDLRPRSDWWAFAILSLRSLFGIFVRQWYNNRCRRDTSVWLWLSNPPSHKFLRYQVKPESRLGKRREASACWRNQDLQVLCQEFGKDGAEKVPPSGFSTVFSTKVLDEC